MNKELNLKNILIDIGLVGLFGAFQCYLIFVLIIYFEGFFICGNQILDLATNTKNLVILLFICGIIETFYIFYFLKSRTVIWKYSSIAILLIIFIVGIFSTVQLYCTNKFYEDFDSRKWKSLSNKPVSMIRTLHEDKVLIGKTREEIRYLLGKENYQKSDEITYHTDCYDPLIIVFENGKVKKLFLRCND